MSFATVCVHVTITLIVILQESFLGRIVETAGNRLCGLDYQHVRPHMQKQAMGQAGEDRESSVGRSRV